MGTVPKAQGHGQNVRTTDNKARVTLPKGFANALVDVEQIDEYEVRIRKVTAIPNREAWLWMDPKAIGAVMIGLAEAKADELIDGPDLATDRAEFGAEE